MVKEIATQVQETQRVPNRINPRQNSPRHILIKLTKIKHKEQILKAAQEKQQIPHKGVPIRITADLSTEILQAIREWQNILKVMKKIIIITYNPDYCTQQGSHSDMKEISEAFSSVHFSCSVESDCLRPQESQHARPPSSSPTPRVYSNSCPLSW